MAKKKSPVKLPTDLPRFDAGVQHAVREFAQECYDESIEPRRRLKRILLLTVAALALAAVGFVFP